MYRIGYRRLEYFFFKYPFKLTISIHWNSFHGYSRGVEMSILAYLSSPLMLTVVTEQLGPSVRQLFRIPQHFSDQDIPHIPKFSTFEYGEYDRSKRKIHMFFYCSLMC